MIALFHPFRINNPALHHKMKLNYQYQSNVEQFMISIYDLSDSNILSFNECQLSENGRKTRKLVGLVYLGEKKQKN